MLPSPIDINTLEILPLLSRNRLLLSDRSRSLSSSCVIPSVGWPFTFPIGNRLKTFRYFDSVGSASPRPRSSTLRLPPDHPRHRRDLQLQRRKRSQRHRYRRLRYLRRLLRQSPRSKPRYVGDEALPPRDSNQSAHLKPVAYVAHVDSGAATLVPDDSTNSRYQEVVATAQQIFQQSPVSGWDVSSAVFSTEGGDIGFAHAVRDGVMNAVGGSPSDADFYSNSDGFVVPVQSDGSFQPILPPTQLNTQRNRNKWNGVELAGGVAWTINS